MTINVSKNGLRLWLAVPASLVAFGLRKAAEKQGWDGSLPIKIDKQTKRELKRSLKKAKRNFGRLVLVDVQASDGTKIKIKL